MSDVFELRVIKSLLENAGDTCGLVFELVKLSFNGAEFVGEMEAGEDGDTRGIACGGAAGDIDHQLINLLRHGFDFGSVAIGQQRVPT